MARRTACWKIKNTEGGVDDETGKPLYWSNEIGWVDKRSADRYKSKAGNLPIGGKWERCGGK